MFSPARLRIPFLVLLAWSALSVGCATSSKTPSSSTAADEEVVAPTGSRISRTVKKGSGGVAGDMPGGTVGAGTLERRNDGAAAARSN